MARFMKPTWGPPGSCRPQLGPMLAQWTLLSELSIPTHSFMLARFACHKLSAISAGIERLKTYMAAAKKQTTQSGRNCYWCIVSVPISMSQGRHGFVCVGWWEWTVGRPTSSSVNLSMAASEGPFIADSIAVQFSLQYIFFYRIKKCCWQNHVCSSAQTGVWRFLILQFFGWVKCQREENAYIIMIIQIYHMCEFVPWLVLLVCSSSHRYN